MKNKPVPASLKIDEIFRIYLTEKGKFILNDFEYENLKQKILEVLLEEMEKKKRREIDLECNIVHCSENHISFCDCSIVNEALDHIQSVLRELLGGGEE